MVNIYDVDPNDLIEKVAEELKKIDKIKAPQWGSFVKTGAHKERPPVRGDWWHIRAASVLRSVSRLGPIGVSKLRTKYGGKRNRGADREVVYKASGNILRKILQQLEQAELIKKQDKDIHKGRKITPAGIKILTKAAGSLESALPPKTESKKKEAPKAEVKKEGAKTEEKKKEAKPKEKVKPAEEKPKVEEKKAETKQVKEESKAEEDKQKNG